MIDRLIQFFDVEKRKWNRLNKRQRKEYLWDYYRVPISVSLILAVIVILVFSFSILRTEADLHVVMVNAGEGNPLDLQNFIDKRSKMGSSARIDINQELTLRFKEETASSDIQTIQVLAALFAVGDMDLFVADREVFSLYAQKDGFENLAVLLPQELQKKHEELLYRYTNESGQEKVGGIVLPSHSLLHDTEFYDFEVVIGIAVKARNLENAIAAVEIVMENLPDF